MMMMVMMIDDYGCNDGAMVLLMIVMIVMMIALIVSKLSI